MRILPVAVLFIIGTVLAAAVLVNDPLHDPWGARGFGTTDPIMEETAAGIPVDQSSSASPANRHVNTVLFSKFVSADTPYIVVSIYSGDPADPLSLVIITPDRTLGPFDDGSDGRIDGRIDLKINNPDNMMPGLWKFQIKSYKNISYGSLENLSWIKTGMSDHNADDQIK